jgi:hypothetical protein
LAASYFEWGLIENEFIYELFSQTLLGGIALGHQADPTDLDAAEAIANADSQSSDPDFQSWIRIPDSEKPGDMREAKAYVRLNRWGGSDVLELVFCIFYPYNGPGQFRISIGSEEFFNYLPDDSRGIGKHYSDWEAVILRFSRDEHAPDPYTLEYVGMTAHGKMRVAPAALLESRESHPIVYVALESHAHYPFANPRPFYYERIFEWDLEILTIAGDLFDETAYDPLVSAHLESALDYEVISAEITEFGLDANGGLIVVSAQGAVDVDEPPWLDFEGRWGQFEELRMTFTVLDYPAHTMIDVSAGAKSPKTGAYWTAGWLF